MNCNTNANFSVPNKPSLYVDLSHFSLKTALAIITMSHWYYPDFYLKMFLLDKIFRWCNFSDFRSYFGVNKQLTFLEWVKVNKHPDCGDRPISMNCEEPTRTTYLFDLQPTRLHFPQLRSLVLLSSKNCSKSGFRFNFYGSYFI